MNTLRRPVLTALLTIAFAVLTTCLATPAFAQDAPAQQPEGPATMQAPAEEAQDAAVPDVGAGSEQAVDEPEGQVSAAPEEQATALEATEPAAEAADDDAATAEAPSEAQDVVDVENPSPADDAAATAPKQGDTTPAEAKDGDTPAQEQASQPEETEAVAVPALSARASQAIAAAASTTHTSKATQAAASVAVSDGVYVIYTSGGKALAVKGRSTAAGAHLNTSSADHSAAQRFRITAAGTSQGEKTYRIVSVLSGKALEAGSAGKAAWQAASSSSKAQTWFIRQGQGTFVQLVNAYTALALDSASSDVSTQTSGSKASQQWRLSACKPTVRGAHTITTRLGDRTQTVEVAGGNTEATARIQTYKGNGTLAQDFSFNFDDKTGYYRIVNYKTGMLLDVPNGKAKAGEQIWQVANNGTFAQLWDVQKNANGTYSIYSALSGMVLEVQGSKTANGTKIVQATSTGAARQQFNLNKITPRFAGGIVTLRSAADTTLVADLKDGSLSNGASYQLFTSNNSFAQKFGALRQPNGTFVLINAQSGLRLSAAGNGGAVQQKASGAANQYWNLVPTADGHFTFVNVGTKKALGFVNSATKGRNLALIADTKATAAKWNIMEVDLMGDGWVTIRPSGNTKASLDIPSNYWNQGANAAMATFSDKLSQVFYASSEGPGMYRITNALSLLDVNVAGASASANANVNQYLRSSSAAEKWHISVTDGGIVFDTDLGAFSMAPTKAAAGANVALAGTDYTNARRRFVVWGHAAENMSYYNQIRVLDAVKGNGWNIFRSPYGLSEASAKPLRDAVAAYSRMGNTLGFVMIDLKTGAGISYNCESFFRSSSTIKGPYVMALNKYYPGSNSGNNRGLMYTTINTSSNETYAALFAQYGRSPLETLLGETHASQFRWNSNYGFYSANALTKMWVGMSDYFLNNTSSNASWCRTTYSTNNWITSRGTIGHGRTVYAKSGWEWGSGGATHNEGCLVADKNNPYVIGILTTADSNNRYLMQGIMNALDRAHNEMVRR